MESETNTAAYVASQMQPSEETCGNCRQGFWEWHAGTTRAAFSRTFWRLLGFEPSESATSINALLGRIHTDERARVVAAMNGILMDRGEFCTRCRIMTNAGQYRVYQLQAEVFRPVDGTTPRVIGLIAETTDRQEAGQPWRTDANSEEFIYSASHDLQEPLRMVTSFLNLIVRDAGDALGEPARNYLDFAIDGAARMQQQITGLLEYSRTGRQAIHLIDVDTSKMVHSIVAGLCVNPTEPAVTVHVGDLPIVRSDREALFRVFQNLISNAIKYRSQVNPVIEVMADQESDAYVFRVRDNGIGFDPKHAEEIFSMFKRLHTREEYSGSGMGLAICRRLIERLGGHVWAESELGKGATFSFTIPRTLAVSGVREQS